MKRIPEFRCVARYCVAEEQALVTRADLARDFWARVITRAPWYDPEKEVAAILCLNRKNRVTSWNLISIGSASGTVVNPREVLRAALVGGACAFIVMHSHPSGDPAPSAQDVAVTSGIREAAKAVEITFTDHVIFGDIARDPLRLGYYSFREAGLV
jgi:DNA repair protein RadC